MKTPNLYTKKMSKVILIFNICMVFFYLSWWFIPGNIGNPFLYTLLLLGEVYHVTMALTFWFTVWPRSKQKIPTKISNNFNPSVDIYITVAGEPVHIISETVLAAKQIQYPNKKIYILNDGYVAKKTNWLEVENLAKELDVVCITRKIPGGAKAGNINNALRQTTGEIIVIFDADMKPYKSFLQQVLPYFQKKGVGFVQTPQFYKNHNQNLITASAWDQQIIFFAPIMQGKSKVNAAFICGTNVAIRRQALVEVGGMNETSIAEDFLTSLYIHNNKWKSFYHPQIVSEGLAPEDLQSYFNQQLRWARGSLEVLFGHNPLFKRNLTLKQKIEYFSSGLYYLNGVVAFIDMITPVIFLFTGLQPILASTTNFAIFFVPFMVMNLYTVYFVSDGKFSFRAVSFTQSCWTLQLIALVSVLLKRKMSFKVTPKYALTGNFIHLAIPHIIYTILIFSGFIVSLHREGVNPSVITNLSWGLFNIFMFIPFIGAAINWKSAGKADNVSVKPAFKM